METLVYGCFLTGDGYSDCICSGEWNRNVSLTVLFKDVNCLMSESTDG